MSLLQAFLDAFRGRKNPQQEVTFAVSDDGSGDPIPVGELSPLRADPTTGALLVSSSGGGGGGSGEVTQGAGDEGNPWFVQGLDGSNVPERLASNAAVETVNTTLGTPAQEHVGTGSFHSVRITNGSAFIVPIASGDNVLADLRIGSVAVSNSNPVPISDAGGSITVDGSVSATVSGTVTANIGTSGSLALDATLTGGTTKAIVRGGAKGATSAADVTSTAEGADHNAIDTQLYHGGTAINPTQIRALTSSDVVSAAQSGNWFIQPTTSPVVANHMYVRLTKDGANALDQMSNTAGASAPSTSIVIFTMTRGRAYSAVATPGLAYDAHIDTWGRVHTAPSGASPIADATTEVYSQLTPTAFSSGVCNVKNSPGRVRMIHVIYTGATGSSLYLQLHNAVNATTPADSLIRWVVPINSSVVIVDRDFAIDIPCTAGIKLAFSSTASTYTAATSETGVAIVHYA